MQLVPIGVIEADGVRARIQKHGRHSARPGIGLSIAHERAPTSRLALIFPNDDVVDVKVRTARQRMNRPHAEDSDETIRPKCADQFVAAVSLPPDLAQKLLFVEVRAQLHDEGENPRPFARLKAADLQVIHG